MLGHRLRRRPNNKPALGRHFVFVVINTLTVKTSHVLRDPE